MQFESTHLADSAGDPNAGAGRSRFSGGGRRLRSLGILLATVVAGGLILAAIGVARFGSLTYAIASL